MAEGYYADFREYVGALERRGKLHRWSRAVNKDTELMPLMRLQYRGLPDDKRQAFLFENVIDSRGRRHDVRVATGMYGSSREIAALGLGCADPAEIYEKWRQALAKPFEARQVASAPVQEIVYTGEGLKKFGVTSLPAPVEEPGFSGGIRVTAPFITQDAETGVRNVGMYSGHFRGEDRLIAGIAPTHHAMLYHHRAAISRNEPLPVAIVLGALPDINFVSAANLPYGVDELAVAGGIRGRPVDVVPCKTIALSVPIEAEIVIEGEISFDRKERGEPFSDYPGYLMVEREFRAVIDVKAITMRRDAIFTAILAPKYPATYFTLEEDPVPWQMAQFLLTKNATFNPFHSTNGTVAGYLSTMQTGSGAQAATAAKALNRYMVENAWFAPFFRPQSSFVSDSHTNVKVQAGNAVPYLWNITPKES